jgi:hypothetical protein
MVLKAYLNRCSPDVRDSLLRFLPESERLYLAELPNSQEESLSEENIALSSVEKIHWSWFLPTLKAFSANEQRLFLSSLDPHAAEQMKTSLSLTGQPEEVTETGRAFLRQQLLQSLLSPEERILPVEYLPASPMNRLLSLSKKELIRLIDSLALYDLAYEMRQIVETKILKKLYSLLSEEQKNILKQITIYKEVDALPKLGIKGWEGTEESLRTLLHRRGLTRLGIALSGQDPDLIWMICHQLDSGRGGTLFKLLQKEKKSPAADTAQRQIEELLSLL